MISVLVVSVISVLVNCEYIFSVLVKCKSVLSVLVDSAESNEEHDKELAHNKDQNKVKDKAKGSQCSKEEHNMDEEKDHKSIP